MRTTLTLILCLFALPVFAREPIPIKLIDLSTLYSRGGMAHWTHDDYPFAEQALTLQLQAVGKFYDAKRGFRLIGFDEKGGAAARIIIQNQCVIDGQSYAAYHWHDSAGPYGCVASVGGGGYWWITRGMEHEMAEMIGDPSGTGREIVDPVSQWFGEIVNGQFTYDYSDFAGTPFIDFLLPPRAAHAYGSRDYLGKAPVRARR